jgi:23S rRNA pseudouridine1911/1915/1917 synthase
VDRAGPGGAALNPDPAEGRHTLEVGDDGSGERLDVWLSGQLALSRTRVARLVEEGRVLVDGVRPRKSELLSAGMRVEVEVPAPEPSGVEAQAIPLDVVWEDADLLVVNKPAGMVVHPAPGHPRGTLVNALLHHVHDLSGIGGALRPGIVHRLDRDTSGLLVVAKRDRVHQALSEALRARTVRRIYLAAVWGHLKESPVTVDVPIGRDPRDRKRMAVVPGGRRALTRARVRERWPAAELLDVALSTGRTHQIRVHMQHLGHPVVADPVYGAGWERGIGGDAGIWARALARRVPRQFLHAAELAFRHPGTGEPMRFRAPLPDDLAAAVAWARGEGSQEPLNASRGGAESE